MPSVREFTLPDLGEGLTEAQVVRWLVGVGDVVAVDQPVVEVETAKATVEMPAPHAGVVAAIHAAEGDVVDVGRSLMAIAVDREPVLVGYGPVPVVSPVVRKLAKDNGIDVRQVTGSGPGGLVLRSDIDAARDHVGAVRTADTATTLPLRGTAAAKFVRSHREIPDTTCWLDVDATGLLAARTQLSASGPRIGLLALLARICVAGLARHPALNATVDSERAEITRWSAVHMGIAVQSDRGLVVPVVRDAHRLTLVELGRRLDGLTGSTTRTADQLAGGTFTLNNYGPFGVDGSTPILNHPEAAMLGVGRIVDRPWVHDGELAVRKVVQLSLTFDHRVCDGAVAAGFLRFVADHVEQPLRLLREL